MKDHFSIRHNFLFGRSEFLFGFLTIIGSHMLIKYPRGSKFFSISLCDALFLRFDPTSYYSDVTSCWAFKTIFGNCCHIGCTNDSSVNIRAKIFIHFSPQHTVSKINAYANFTILQSFDWLLINEETF